MWGSKRRSGLLLATALALVFTLIIGSLLMYRLHTDSVHTLQQSLNNWRVPLTLVRWAAIVAVALSWHPVLDGLATRGILHPDHADRLRGQYARTLIWLVVLELVLGQGVFKHILSWVSG